MKGSEQDSEAGAAQLLLVPEAAKLLRIEPSTMRSWILKRRIQFVKVFGRVCIRKADIDALIAASVIPTMAGHNDRRGSGCTHAHPISQASRFRATPTRSFFGSSRMESASPGCRLSVKSRLRITFGIS